MDGLQLGWMALGLALALLALFVALWARDLWADTGLPAGKVMYSDTGTWYPQNSPLIDRRLGLAGKPDYLVEEAGGQIIPVEVKSRNAPKKPLQGHVMQLAAYCALVESAYQVRPAYGILQYADRAFSIAFTSELEQDLHYLLNEMRGDLLDSDLPRNHQDRRRCNACGHHRHCADRLI
jgi:CRISPR-associated exonuclease Cas4